MGTNTDFTGAIRITPCVEEPLATRLKQFMDIRHMKRNVKTLHTLFPDLEDRKPMSLFGDGDFGEEGAFFIPVETPDLNRRLHEAGPYPEGLDNKFSMNKPPNPCPSLYCDLVLLNDPNNGRSYSHSLSHNTGDPEQHTFQGFLLQHRLYPAFFLWRSTCQESPLSVEPPECM